MEEKGEKERDFKFDPSHDNLKQRAPNLIKFS